MDRSSRPRSSDSVKHMRLRATRPLLALAGAAGLLVVTILWGRGLNEREPRIKIGAAPFVGEWKLSFDVGMVLPIFIGVAVIVWARRRRSGDATSAKRLIGGASIASAVFAFALAAAHGTTRLLAPVVDPTEYWANLDTMPPIRDSLLFFSVRDFLVDRSVHVKGHPPGFITLLQLMDNAGLRSAWWTLALSYIGIAATTAGVLMSVHRLSGRTGLVAAVPFLIITPYAVWQGTSADPVFSAALAWGVALAIVAAQSERRIGMVTAAVASGLIVGLALHLSYGVGAALPLLIAAALTRADRRWRRAATIAPFAAIGVGAVVATFWWFGFFWLDGLRLTQDFYWIGSAYFRPWLYFAFANIAVSATAIGPAAVIALFDAPLRALRDWRRDRIFMLAIGAVASIALANASQFSKGEVERIWLLFFPWLIAGAIPRVTWRPRAFSVALAAQVLVAVGMETILLSKW